MKINLEEITEICKYHGWTELSEPGRSSRIYISDFSRKPDHPPELEKEILIKWEENNKQRIAKGLKPHYNGELVSYKGIVSLLPDSLGLSAGLTDYMHYSGVRDKPETRIWSLGTAAITYFFEEGQPTFCFATRNKNQAYLSGIIEVPPGGYLDTKILPANLENNCGEHTSSIFLDNLYKEFEEELGLDSKVIVSEKLLSLIQMGDYYDYQLNKLRRFNDTTLVYALEMWTSRNNILEGFKKSKKYGGEHSEQFIVPVSSLTNFIKENRTKLTTRTKINILHLIRGRPELFE